MVSSFFNTFSFAVLTPAISTLPCMAVPPQTLKLHEFSMAGGLFSYTGSFCRFLPVCIKQCWDIPSTA